MDEITIDTEQQSNGAIQKVEAAPIRPTTARARVMAEALKEATEQRALLQAYIRGHMIRGVDFGEIPGTQKPTLLKPGAEKLMDLFLCTAEYELTERIEDWDKGLFHYEYRARIRSRESGIVLAEGVGSANSREGRYRWRNAHRKCPACGKEAIFKSKFPPRDDPSAAPGWYCHKKAGGCGENFSAGDDRIESQVEGKVENDDIATLVNTILKMAKKRALVDGAIALARVSDIFTQDVEDIVDAAPEDAPPAARREAARREAPRQSAARSAPAQQEKKGNPPHVTTLWDDAGKEYGTKGREAKWRHATHLYFKGQPPHPSTWTEEQTAGVRAELFGPKDVA